MDSPSNETKLRGGEMDEIDEGPSHQTRHSILLEGSAHTDHEAMLESSSNESTTATPSKERIIGGHPIIKPFIVCSKLLGKQF